MQLKQYKQYRIDFRSKWIQPSAMFMGLSFFLRIFYYFGFRFVSDWSFADVIFQIILPLLLCATYTVMLWTFKRNQPGLFGIIGSALCLLAGIWSFYTGDVLYIILCVLYYTGTAVVFLATCGGFLPGVLLSSAMLAIPIFVRLVSMKPFQLGIDGMCLTFSVLFMLASLFSFTRCLKESNFKKK